MAELDFRSPLKVPAPTQADDPATRGYVDGAVTQGVADAVADITPASIGAQPADADLSAIAALAPADGSVLRRISGAWSSSTIAEVKAALALSKADVGLGSVDNTSDAAKPISTATQTALNGKAATVHTHAGADIASGTIDAARLPRTTGTPRTQAHATTITIDASLGSLVNVAATANETFNAPTNGTDRQILRLAVYCAAARTISFATAIRLSTGLTSRDFAVPAGQVLLAALEYLTVGSLNIWVLTAATVTAT